MNRGKHEILVVEDDAGDALLLQEALNEASPVPIEWVRVPTLREARAALAARSFDLVFLDLMLPDSAGLQTLARLRAESAAPPIIVLSGSEDEELARQAVDAGGAQYYLIKGLVDGYLIWCALRIALRRRHEPALGV
jgi:DNA-binding response OmpR family regulator